MNKHTLSLSLALCLGFTTLTACGPGPGDPMSALPNQTAVQPTNTNSALALKAQAALASYHEVDASFADSQRISRSGFSTKLLGDLLGDDDNDSDNSGSGSLDLGVGVNVDANANGSGSSSNSGSGSGSLGLGVGVDANANASGSGSSNNSSNNGSGSLNLGTNIDANANASATGSGNSGNSSSSNSGSGNLMANLNTSLSADAMYDSFDDFSSQFRNNLEATGYASFTDEDSYNVNDSKLEADLRAMLNLDSQFSDSNDSDSTQALTQLASDNMLRLHSRNYQGSYSNAGSETLADGSVKTHLMTRFTGNGSERNIDILDHVKADAHVATDLKLQESGDGFTRNATRRSQLQADGSVRVMTWATTNFENGDVLEIFEDRHGSAQGAATGTGTFHFKSNNGSQESGDLRTMVTADGSLTSYLDLEDGNDLMIRESANGMAHFSQRGTSGWDSNWTQLDFNAMLDSMTRIASNND